MRRAMETGSNWTRKLWLLRANQAAANTQSTHISHPPPFGRVQWVHPACGFVFLLHPRRGIRIFFFFFYFFRGGSWSSRNFSLHWCPFGQNIQAPHYPPLFVILPLLFFFFFSLHLLCCFRIFLSFFLHMDFRLCCSSHYYPYNLLNSGLHHSLDWSKPMRKLRNESSKTIRCLLIVILVYFLLVSFHVCCYCIFQL